VKRILISLIAICVMGGFAAAQTTGKPVILYGCYYPGPNPDICQYFVYSGLPLKLVIPNGVFHPLPNQGITVIGMLIPEVKPLCLQPAGGTLTASKITPSSHSCPPQ
jgi:hypothetical protein